MQFSPNAITFALLAAAALTFSGGPSYSFDLPNLSDPTGLGGAAESGRRAIAELRALEEHGNKDAANRIEQIRADMLELVNAAADRAKDILNDIKTIEQDAYVHAVKLIYQVNCAAEIALSNQLQRAIVNVLGDLKKSNPTLSWHGHEIAKLDVSSIPLTNPDEDYRILREKSLTNIHDRLEKNPNSNAYDILSTYQNLKITGFFTRCYYLLAGDSALAVRLSQDIREFESLSEPWVVVVNPR